MAIEKIDKIKKVSERIESLTIDKPSSADTTMMKERFEALLNQEGKQVNSTEQATKETAVQSPIDSYQKDHTSVQPTQAATPESVQSQVQRTANRLEEVKLRVQATENTELHPSMTGMLKKKLLHIDSSIESALAKAKAKESDPLGTADRPVVDNALNPIHRFVGLLTHGQHNLSAIEYHMESLQNNNELNPVQLMSVQLKVARVQQEIELFTSLLNKALESTKTIMNIQV